MYSIEIRAMKGNEVRDYQYSHMNLDIFYNDFLFDVTVGLDKTKLKEFRSKTIEENIQKLAEYLIGTGHKVRRVKPIQDDWTLSKLLIDTLHDFRNHNIFR